MGTLFKVVIRITIILIFTNACTKEGKRPPLNGIWVQEGYGRIIEISDSTYTYYNTTENSCLPLVSGKLKERFKIVKLDEDKLILNPGGIVDYRFKRSDALPTICEQENLNINQSPERNFEIFWKTFDRHYAFFEKRNINWDKVKENYLPLAKEIKSDQDLYDLFVEIIEPFNDGHIKLDVPDSLLNQKRTQQKSVTDKKSKEDVKADILKEYVSKVKSYNNGLIQWGYLKNSEVAYILVSDMNDFAHYVTTPNLSKEDFQTQYDEKLQSKSAIEQFSDELEGVDFIMEEILKDFINAKSLIVDLRFNGGGYETVALKLLSYFVDEPKHVFSIKAKMGTTFTKEQKYTLEPSINSYDGKVFLLTSKRTASAAEIFALGAMAYPKIKSYGSSTNGIFSEILWKNLPNSWEFSLSNEIYSDANGKEYEIIGVPVNEDMGYPKGTVEFYDSFYKEGYFKDLTIESILRREGRKNKPKNH